MDMKLEVMPAAMDFAADVEQGLTVKMRLGIVEVHGELRTVTVGRGHHFPDAEPLSAKLPPDQAIEWIAFRADRLGLHIDSEHQPPPCRQRAASPRSEIAAGGGLCTLFGHLVRFTALI
jgi:hypothetical protein